jgi:hypothetical protein
MKSKLWVGVSLIIFVVLVVNIIGFGVLQDYQINNNAALIINKNNSSLKDINLDNSTIINNTSNQNAVNTPNQLAIPSQEPIIINDPPRLITRAS